MTRWNFVVLCVALLGLTLAGCQAHNDFQKKWPQYPHWGWWKQPAKGVEEPAPPPSAGDDANEDARADDATTDNASPQSLSKGPTTLEEHRADVWEEVAVLRDLDELSPPQQRKLIESARRKRRKWYRPMTVSAPAPDDPQWITILVWDFMPEDDFQSAVENWRRIARQDDIPFPQDITRRELMVFIQKMTDGEFAPAKPTPRPAGPTDKGKGQ